jgi:glycosyltransferase involved in cell wall biosynthesis
MSSPLSVAALPYLAHSSIPSISASAAQFDRLPIAHGNHPLIAFCHLTWDGVWQRPQQLLSRLSRSREVLFVETHCGDVPTTEVRIRGAAGFPQVTIMAMHLPAKRWDDGAFIDLERRRALSNYRHGDNRFDSPVLWFNDPMAVTAFAGHCDEAAIVYDCMDELSQFHGAPPELQIRERALLACADVVFCGGRKMRDKRLPLNRNTHFYGTGVECTHFGRARDDSTTIDPAIAALPGKVIGYFGVIDERIDYALLDALAISLPDCTIAMVGPVTKVNPDDFPQHANLRWMGRRAYADLPAITKGFSVCLMPFARNAATEFINPTKALEYMAAGRPVVSTALDEVKSNFASVCRIAENTEQFIDFCREESTTPNQARIERGLSLAAENTWEMITDQMDAHIVAALRTREVTRDPVKPSRTPVRGVLSHV